MDVYYFYKYSFDISVENITKGIKNSDFLVADSKCTHRLIGLKYDFHRKNVSAPVITIICSRYEMVVGKQIAFLYGKKIYTDAVVSSLLYSKYWVGQTIRPNDYKIIAQLYGKFMRRKKTVRDCRGAKRPLD